MTECALVIADDAQGSVKGTQISHFVGQSFRIFAFVPASQLNSRGYLQAKGLGNLLF